jgi:hypothetical protein
MSSAGKFELRDFSFEMLLEGIIQFGTDENGIMFVCEVT